MLGVRLPSALMSGIALVIIAVYLSPRSQNVANMTFQQLSQLAAQSTGPAHTRIAIGLNGNLDMIAPAVPVFQSLGLKPTAGKDHMNIASFGDLQDTFSYVFPRCQAAERFVSNAAIFAGIVEAAEGVMNVKYSIGGNAALMGNAFQKRGSQVLLGGAIGPKLKGLLPTNSLSYPAECELEKDEVHLILEYQIGDKFGSYRAPCANRLILTRDFTNAEIKALEPLAAQIPAFDPSLLVVSGVNIMEGADLNVRSNRLAKLKEFLQESKAPTVHLELASFGDLVFLKESVQTLFPHADSLGLNEQELAAVISVTGGPAATAAIASKPTVNLVADALLWTLQHFGPDSGSKLSRIHFHSLTFHITAQRTTKWQSAVASAASASLIATTQACNFTQDSFDDSKVLLRFSMSGSYQIFSDQPPRQFDPRNPITVWSYDDIEFTLSPVLVCKKPLHTVGLGDAISATGLLYSKRVSMNNAVHAQ